MKYWWLGFDGLDRLFVVGEEKKEASDYRKIPPSSAGIRLESGRNLAGFQVYKSENSSFYSSFHFLLPHSEYYGVVLKQGEVQAVETAGKRGKIQGGSQASRKKTARRAAHFQTVRRGGFEETQIICYLWDVVKSMEAAETAGAESASLARLSSLKKQLHRQIRVEMRRYFLRKKRRCMICACNAAGAVLFVICLLGFVIGIDRVSGESMYPYLNHGDWIVYSRLGREFQRDEVVVFARKGENYVKRIAGLPGDTVEISGSGSRVVVNGVQMRESYVTLTSPVTEDDGSGEGDPMGDALTIMDRQYLVLGDNRSVSIDSRNRDMGTVPEEEILGRVVLVVRMRGK